MTSIAYRDGVLAADSGVQSRGTRIGSVQKVFKAKDGSLLAYAGDANLAADVAEWVDGGLRHDSVPDTADRGTILWVQPDGSVHIIDGGGKPYPVEAPFYAEGSGEDLALGAMAAGASAVQAIEIAIHFDSGSSGPVQFVELEKADVIPLPKRGD